LWRFNMHVSWRGGGRVWRWWGGGVGGLPVGGLFFFGFARFVGP
jgi:hypothetical protein